MDDSDRSRDEPSPPEDDSVDDDGTVDSAGGARDKTTETDGETADNDRSDDSDSEDAEASASVESEVSPEVTSEIGTSADAASDDADEDGGDDGEGSEDGHQDSEAGDGGEDDSGGDGEDDEDGTFDAHEPGSAEHLDYSKKPDLDAGSSGDEGEEEADAPTVEDGGVAGGTAVGNDDEIGGLEAPETDEEMPLAAHIEEMMRRLAVVFVFGGLATLVVVTESTELINYFWSYHIPAPMENRPRLYGPLELPLTRLKVAGLAGVVVGLPAFVYQTYRFMKPGLYENERRYYLAAVPTSLILGGIGIAFAHFLVLPAIFSYFTTYTSDAATIAFGLAETFNLIVIMLAIMMNLVTRQWLEAKRLIFWGSFLGIAFLFSPDPTGMAPIIVTLTMIVLYEGTLAVLRWTGN
jgi:sec-independent protein translocase protein TatC